MAEANVGVRIFARTNQFVAQMKAAQRAVSLLNKALIALWKVLSAISLISRVGTVGAIFSGVGALSLVYNKLANDMLKAADAGEKFLSTENLRGYRAEMEKFRSTLGGVFKIWKDFQVGFVFGGLARTLVAIQNATPQFRLMRAILDKLYGPQAAAAPTVRTIGVGSTPAVSGVGGGLYRNAKFLTVIEQSVRSIDSQIKKLDKV